MHFTRMPAESYCKQTESLLLCSCNVFRAPVNSLPTPGLDRVKDGLPVFLSQHLYSLVSARLAFVQSTRKVGCAR